MMFDAPLLLYGAPAVAVLVLLLAILARRRRIKAAMVWSETLGRLAGRGWAGPFVLALVALIAAAALAGPRWGAAQVDTESRALNLVIAIDISRSMLAEDTQPSRLERAVREARRLLQDARGDRVALIAFAGRSYILTPLTLDDGAVELQLDALDPDVASEGGTELAAVLRQGGELLSAANEGGARALVVFTDGEAHDSLESALEAARALRAAGATVIMIGEGGVKPVRIPIKDPAGSLVEYKKDATGQVVFTARRDEILRAVADAAQGILIPADFADQAGAAWKTIATLDRDTARGHRTEDLIPRAWIGGLIAGLLLVVHAATRRGAALIAVVAAVLVPRAAAAQRPAAGERRVARGDTATAVSAFVRAAKEGVAADTSWYNAGTLALQSGHLDVAEEALGAASRSLDPAVRFQALYNLGLSAMRQAKADTGRREALEDEAATRFRDALLINPSSFAAKWNLELVSRRKPPTPPSSSNQPQPKSGGGGTPQPKPSSMSPSEAEQILRSVERAEQGVRADQMRRRRTVKSVADKDW
jgi:Ca-activated chloride channel family protein